MANRSINFHTAWTRTLCAFQPAPEIFVSTCGHSMTLIRTSHTYLHLHRSLFNISPELKPVNGYRILKLFSCYHEFPLYWIQSNVKLNRYRYKQQWFEASVSIDRYEIKSDADATGNWSEIDSYNESSGGGVMGTATNWNWYHQWAASGAGYYECQA